MRNLQDASADQCKFCTLIITRPNFIMPVQNFGAPPQKNSRGQKHAKFGSILGDFKLWHRMSLERMNIFEIWQVHFLPRLFPRWVKEFRWTLVH